MLALLQDLFWAVLGKSEKHPYGSTCSIIQQSNGNVLTLKTQVLWKLGLWNENQVPDLDFFGSTVISEPWSRAPRVLEIVRVRSLPLGKQRSATRRMLEQKPKPNLPKGKMSLRTRMMLLSLSKKPRLRREFWVSSFEFHGMQSPLCVTSLVG